MNEPTVIEKDNLPVAGAWTPMFVFDLAMGIDALDDVLTRHNVTWDEWRKLEHNLSFRRELLLAQKEIAEHGVSFKRKSALQAEEYLFKMDALMHDVTTPASVRVDIFKTLAKLGELEPAKTKSDDSAGSGATFNIQINID
jgi:hypothetical protein